MGSISTSNKRPSPGNIVVFDFFCGCGGTSRGFQLSGMDIVWALDNNPVAAKTFKLNFPTAQFHCKSIDELEENDLKPIFEKGKLVYENLLQSSFSMYTQGQKFHIHHPQSLHRPKL